jgi:hypothetical protein
MIGENTLPSTAACDQIEVTGRRDDRRLDVTDQRAFLYDRFQGHFRFRAFFYLAGLLGGRSSTFFMNVCHASSRTDPSWFSST